MKGHGTSYGAVSVMNAIPCGIGSTIGVGLRTDVEFCDSDEKKITLTDRPNTSTNLVECCVTMTRQEIGVEQSEYELIVNSQIPPSVGLKSSSSVCNATIAAVLDAYGEKMDMLDIIRLGVKCARMCNVTITGAFDDACGCGLGGLVVTDNSKNELLYRSEIPDYDVIICIPDKRIPRSKVPIESYKAMKDRYQSMVGMIKDDYLDVLTKNGEYVAEIIGASPINSKLAISCGALAAGITGTGPATAVIARHGEGKKISEQLGCRTILTVTR